MRFRRGISLVLVWASFYEQLSWAPILVVFATLAGDPAVLAIAASAYSLANMVGNLSFGNLADRIGRFKVAAGGFLALAGTTLLHPLASTPNLLVGTRLLHGLAAAAIAPAAFAALSDGIPRDRRAQTMARAGLLIALASMMSPPMTGILESRMGPVTTIQFSAVGLLLIGFVAVLAARGQGAKGATAHSSAAGPDGGSIPSAPAPSSPTESVVKEPFDLRILIASMLVGFAVMFCQNVLFYALPLKGDAMGLPTSQIGALFSAFAVGAVIGFVPPASRFADRYGRRLPITIGLAVAAIGYTGLAVSNTPATIAVSLFFYGGGFGLIFPAVTALNADGSPASRRGAAFGMLTASFSAGAITGPLITRSLDAYLSPFLTASCILTLALVLVAPLTGRSRVSAPTFTAK